VIGACLSPVFTRRPRLAVRPRCSSDPRDCTRWDELPVRPNGFFVGTDSTAIEEIGQSREDIKVEGDRWNEPGGATAARFE
jgi:hypothetical protein